MKRIKLFSICMLLSLQASAWVSTAPPEKEYRFKFTMEQQVFEYSLKSNTYEQAFERAAQACFHHFKAGRRVSEDRGLDIIDVCANPRTI